MVMMMVMNMPVIITTKMMRNDGTGVYGNGDADYADADDNTDGHDEYYTCDDG